MKTISLLLVAAGLLLGPAYWIYAKFYTGAEVARIDLKHNDEALPVWSSPAFKLKADMAPAGLTLRTQASLAPNMDEGSLPEDAYLATLSHAGVSADPLGITLKASSSGNTHPVFNNPLILMEQVQAGDYQLTVQAASPVRMPVTQMTLLVREHITEPEPNVVMAGIILFILGILGLVTL